MLDYFYTMVNFKIISRNQIFKGGYEKIYAYYFIVDHGSPVINL